MRKALLLGLTCLSLLGCNASISDDTAKREIKTDDSYIEYTNVGYCYNDDLTYTVELEDKQYILPIENVFWARKYDARINNKFYLGVVNKLVIFSL